MCNEMSCGKEREVTLPVAPKAGQKTPKPQPVDATDYSNHQANKRGISNPMLPSNSYHISSIRVSPPPPPTSAQHIGSSTPPGIHAFAALLSGLFDTIYLILPVTPHITTHREQHPPCLSDWFAGVLIFIPPIWSPDLYDDISLLYLRISRTML